MNSNLDVRPSPIAGRWYPGNPDELERSLDNYLAQVEVPTLDGEIIGIMVPHAGLVYSGPVAAHAFKLVQGLKPSLVVVVSPMHHPYPYEVLTSGHDAYHTPLGNVEIDQESVDQLDSYLTEEIGLSITPVRMDPEHALEIELPFLIRVLDQPFKLLPVMLREQTRRVCQAVGNGIAELASGKEVLLVASTDLSHFYPHNQAKIYDQEVLRRIESFDPEAIIRMEDENKGYACGRGAIASVMWASKALGADQAIAIHYATSGDVTGDYQQVVGYGAAVFVRKEG